LLEPFYGGSHKLWADGLKKHSRHKIDISSLPDRHWKWRMHGSALTFAERHKNDINQYDLVLVTDLCDVAALKGLLKIEVPVVLYFHENQLAYPWSPTDDDVRLKRDRHYVWINFISAMAADHCWFNSAYNRDSFTEEIKGFLTAFPDHTRYDHHSIIDKSRVVPLGLDLQPFLQDKRKQDRSGTPHILWNHRWEYDKDPETFFQVLKELKDEGCQFQLSVVGTHTRKYPEIFHHVEEWFQEELIHFGKIESHTEYVQVLQSADILPVTSNQDFFGISVVEAIAAGCIPILPNRLAYPEHLPDHFRELLYYDDRRSLKGKIIQFIEQPQELDLIPYVKDYDWRHSISRYDELLYEIYAQGKC
jgi:glycosyltransferase involved in cell wall biosynthesis